MYTRREFSIKCTVYKTLAVILDSL